ncbi:MAG: diaminopimelate decarboxylase [Burkholderiales bacterium]|nr:diaminopimelate decarboxylase [Burkholderiales bacterium]
MSHFHYQAGALYAEQTPLTAIAQEIGTPCYVYSKAALLENFAAYAQARKGHDSLICYSVKSNSNLAILNLLAQSGSGFDIVSGGELLRVLAAGGDPQKVIFSGVGKSRAEMQLALKHNVACFNVESIAELHRLNAVAGEMGCVAPISLRVNPNVDAKTHPYISTGLKENKFGIAFDDALATYRLAHALPNLVVHGIDCHIGSQLLDDAPLLEALDRLIELVDLLDTEGIHLQHLDIGGGLGICYEPGIEPVAISSYLEKFFARIDAWRSEKHGGKSIKIVFEPGRSIVGNVGVLLTTVEFLKPGELKNFAIVDAAMNDLMRPALYEAWHHVCPLQQREGEAQHYDIVGPVCESSDWLAKDRPLVLAEGDQLALMSAGAYGMTMASNYNTRPRAAEVLVDGAQWQIVRQREKTEDLFALESLSK